MTTTNAYVSRVIGDLKEKYPHEQEFIQAVTNLFENIAPVLTANPQYEANSVLERLVEPERVISFRVAWTDDEGKVQVNRGYRVQYNSLAGPYKGGTRFDPSVNENILKFLAFEQTFKNSLTGLPMGGGKGGADFNPRGKSDGEIMRFCQAYMTELSRYLGPHLDVPAGDLGCGPREVGYLYGQYKRLVQPDAGVITGKPVLAGGSLGRTEATGYGVVYFANQLIESENDQLAGKKVFVSGMGVVAFHAARKAEELGAKVVGISNMTGALYNPEGIDLDYIDAHHAALEDDIEQYLQAYPDTTYSPGSLWAMEADYEVALPCATQNEIDYDKAVQMVKNGVQYVVEGANMPSNTEAIHYYLDQGIMYAPGKAANAGGVGVSLFEMSQNGSFLAWTFDEVDQKLHGIMESIFDKAKDAMETYGLVSLAAGADAAGFIRVADLMILHGVI